jgi:hypothetical protein
MKFCYTGIESRSLPIEWVVPIGQLATELQELGLTLRSGGADGADTAFEYGVDNTKPNCMEIYLPWLGFNGRSKTDNHIFYYPPLLIENALALASENHPNWNNLSSPVKKLMMRNCFQVLGNNLEWPSLFLVCWTPDGCEHDQDRTINTGGTGLAISVADKAGILVYNLNNYKYGRTPDERCSSIIAYAKDLIKGKSHAI